MKDATRQFEVNTAYQSGVVTTFTGVMILVLLTLMMFFAIRVGIFEQRVSANEMRQKEAFHAAEAGINYAKEFIRANGKYVASSVLDLGANLEDGWLAGTSDQRWQRCSEWAAANSKNLLTDKGSHPCFGESIPAQRANSYYYSFNGTELPVNTTDDITGDTEQVAVEALLCVLDVVSDADVPVQGCVTDPASALGIGDGTYFMVTLLARGEADCDNDGVCTAEALVSEQVSNFGAAAGGNTPNVPLTTKNSFPPSGTAEVVANPNAGGVGVPVTVWMNKNSQCGAADIDPSSGSWATCEYNEWYETESIPEGIECTGNCSCSFAEAISYTKATDDILGIDLISDPDFPCDLFQFYFGIPRAEYEVVKGYSKVISDCNSLGPDSFGIYWITGAECLIDDDTSVGSPEAPVLLISAASLTKLVGTAKIFGTLFVTDVEDSSAEIEVNGTNAVYGSVIVDATVGLYNGTFQVVWNENIARKAGAGGGLGSVLGGWSDFHRDWE